MRKLLCIFLMLFIAISYSYSQELNDGIHSYKPLVVKLNDNGEKYLRFIVWGQMWGKFTEPNEGYVDLQGNQIDATYDIGIRRARFLAYAQVSPRFLFLIHIGVNNQQFSGGGAPGAGAKKPQVFVHDMWTEFKVYDNYLDLGAGLHYWHGLSRLTNSSTLNFMTIDAPIFNWPVIELTDQFARQMGIYAKGKVGKLDYRFNLNKPFIFGDNPNSESLNQNSRFIINDNLSTAGYLNYQFLDQESNKLPYMVGTYLGKKEIFNIGAGFKYHPESMGTADNNNVELHDQVLLSADIFYEKPFDNGDKALSIYSVFYNFDFGPNYVRNIGIMSSTGISGSGANAQPTVGTGQIFYTQAGYMFGSFNEGQHLMPFLTVTLKNFEGLEDMTNQFDAGLNYLINGHNAKVTLQYSARPKIKSNKQDGYLSELILQTHIFL